MTMNVSDIMTSMIMATSNLTENITKLMTLPAITMTSPPKVADDVTTASPGNVPLYVMKQITGDIPEFEIILPCIFGIFIILSLGLMVFYTKNPTDDALYTKTKEIEGDNPTDNKHDNAWF